MFLSLVFGANQNPFKQFLIYNIREPHEFDSFWEKSVSFWYAWTILTIGTYRLKTEATYCTSISSSGTQTRDILCYCSPGSRFFRREQRVRTRRCRCGTRSCVSHLDGEIYFWITLCYAEIKLSDWFKELTWLGPSNHNPILQQSLDTLCQNLFLTSTQFMVTKYYSNVMVLCTHLIFCSKYLHNECSFTIGTMTIRSFKKCIEIAVRFVRRRRRIVSVNCTLLFYFKFKGQLHQIELRERERAFDLIKVLHKLQILMRKKDLQVAALKYA